MQTQTMAPVTDDLIESVLVLKNWPDAPDQVLLQAEIPLLFDVAESLDAQVSDLKAENQKLRAILASHVTDLERIRTQANDLFAEAKSIMAMAQRSFLPPDPDPEPEPEAYVNLEPPEEAQKGTTR